MSSAAAQMSFHTVLREMTGKDLKPWRTQIVQGVIRDTRILTLVQQFIAPECKTPTLRFRIGETTVKMTRPLLTMRTSDNKTILSGPDLELILNNERNLATLQETL